MYIGHLESWDICLLFSVLAIIVVCSPVKASNCHISWYGSWKIAAEDLLVDLITKGCFVD
ncbi:hypothetical protein HanRHA438_Chr14g0642571 [Helianthus annuus]|nr:hypothetical protein HanRHA438_Chr14g0642571 [Helianthus annuus]